MSRHVCQEGTKLKKSKCTNTDLVKVADRPTMSHNFVKVMVQGPQKHYSQVYYVEIHKYKNKYTNTQLHTAERTSIPRAVILYFRSGVFVSDFVLSKSIVSKRVRPLFTGLFWRRKLDKDFLLLSCVAHSWSQHVENGWKTGAIPACFLADFIFHKTLHWDPPVTFSPWKTAVTSRCSKSPSFPPTAGWKPQ